MRIAFVVHDFDRAFGHGRYVVELASRFAGDHDVHVYSNTCAEQPPGVQHHHVPAVRVSALTTILSFYPAATFALRETFDVVHAQGFSVAGANVVTAHISNRQWRAARERLCGGRLPWRERLFGAVVTPLERHALQAPNATVISVSASLRQELQNDGIAGPIVVIPHGVDLGQFNPTVAREHRSALRNQFGCRDVDETVFLFVGDLRKGFEQALAAFACLRNRNTRLVAVTRTDPEQMRLRAQQLGVGDRVQIQPATPHIERCYGAVDAFVFPTAYDAFGLVITEAMACGLPVVTTAAAGAADLIEDGRTGFVVRNSEDLTALTRHMTTLAEDPTRRASIGSAALAAMQTHSWNSVAEQTLAVYRQVAGTRQPLAA